MNNALYLGLILNIVAYLACCGLVFNSKTWGTIRSMFIITYLSMVIWGFGYLFAGSQLTSNPFILWPFLETIQIVTWSSLLLAIIDSKQNKLGEFLRNKYVLIIFAAAIIFNLTLNFSYLSPDTKFKLLISGGLLGSIVQLILLEQIYRNAADQKWAYKPLILGLATINIFHLICNTV